MFSRSLRLFEVKGQPMGVLALRLLSFCPFCVIIFFLPPLPLAALLPPPPSLRPRKPIVVLRIAPAFACTHRRIPYDPADPQGKEKKKRTTRNTRKSLTAPTPKTQRRTTTNHTTQEQQQEKKKHTTTNHTDTHVSGLLCPSL